MPISGPTSYLSTTDEFGNHWGAANTALGENGPLVLPDGTVVAGLLTRRDNLSTRRGFLQGELNTEEMAREDLSLKRIAMQARLVQYCEKVRVFYPNSTWARTLPELPSAGDSPNRFYDPMDDISNSWGRINADPASTGPLVLLNGHNLIFFRAAVAQFKAAHTALTVASGNVRLAREARNDEQDLIYAIFKLYREVFPTYFDKDHLLSRTLPRLTPLPGSTPTSVVATAVWVPAQQKVLITFTESDDPHLDHFEVRICLGPNYSTDDESVVASIEPDQPRELLTDAGLTAPGSTITVKVYVITTAGNESGSNAVVVTRPSED